MKNMLNTTGLLIINENAVVTVSKAILQDFVSDHINLKGKPTVICNGTVRRLKWKNLGAGFWEIWTEQI
jgi:hypothetical protein